LINDLEWVHPSATDPLFFGLPHGRPVAYFSALTSVAEARGFNAYYLARNLDGLKVAPDTHIVIFENDHVRVLERCATFYRAQIELRVGLFGRRRLARSLPPVS